MGPSSTNIYFSFDATLYANQLPFVLSPLMSLSEFPLLSLNPVSVGHNHLRVIADSSKTTRKSSAMLKTDSIMLFTVSF